MVISQNSANKDSVTERAENVLAGLQELSAAISKVEAHNQILTSDYGQICEDAIASVTSLKNHIGQTGNSNFSNIEKIHPIVASNKIQNIINIAGNSIETGLDKLGDGLIFPIQGIVDIITRMRQ